MKLPMEECDLRIEQGSGLGAGEIWTKAASIFANIPAWVLIEYPTRIFFANFYPEMASEALAQAAKMAIFGENAELLWQKSGNQQYYRVICKQEGQSYQRRLTESLLRNQKGRHLLHADYFKEDESGFLIYQFSTLRGIN